MVYISGGQLSSIKTLVDDACAAGLNIESVENIGPRKFWSLCSNLLDLLTNTRNADYARTLREWNRRFCRNYDAQIKPALLKTYPELEERDLEIFRRKWMCEFEQ